MRFTTLNAELNKFYNTLVTGNAISKYIIKTISSAFRDFYKFSEHLLTWTGSNS